MIPGGLEPPAGRRPGTPDLAGLRTMLRRLEAGPPRPGRRPTTLDDLGLLAQPTPHGPALVRQETVALDPELEALVAPGAEAGTVFLDTETTGLAGGTGTHVFLVGLAAWDRDGLRVTQYFLGDLGAELAFLHAVGEALTGARRIVTFNGRTFDLPLLETRYLLARWPFPATNLPHQDLCPLARALWRELVPDCRLTTLEAAVLGLDRGDDLPGAFVPSLYFRYLRGGGTGELPRIFTHNRWDLLALAALAGRAQAVLAGPGPGHTPREWLGAARWLERRDAVRSACFYEAAITAGLGPPQMARAARRLGALWRREGRCDAALALLARIGGALDPPPLGLVVDLAKLLEHHARDYEAALRWTRDALGRAAGDGWEAWPDLAESLRRRERRLERRVDGRRATRVG